MPTHLEWSDIALRLALAFLAGLLTGFNRSKYGHAAGMRTTLLVCLAAAVAMLQANLLLAVAGRRPDSFIMMDLMRLPLGILSGIGFIGGGAILRRGNMIQGVTTAATLWFVTVIGLCFGGGQIGLGLAALFLALVILWGLKWVEERMREHRAAVLSITSGAGGPGEAEVRAELLGAELRITGCAVTFAGQARSRRMQYSIWWRGRETDTVPPPVLDRLARLPGVEEVSWCPNSVEQERKIETQG